MYKLAVVGNPIEHSLSPIVFSLFAKQCGVNLNYERVFATDNTDFSYKVNELFAQGYLAINITSPFKQCAYNITQHRSARARFCQATNLLIKTETDGILADTTDGIGLVADLQVNLKLKIAQSNILILGSGYVLDSILLDLIVHNPNSIDILARNIVKTEQLNAKFGTGIFNQHKQYDLILNSSPNSVDNCLFQQITQISGTTFCYDLSYTKSLFLAAMLQLNPEINKANGLGMLVEQAKVAFIRLFKYIPDTQIILGDLSRMGHHV